MATWTRGDLSLAALAIRRPTAFVLIGASACYGLTSLLDEIIGIPVLHWPPTTVVSRVVVALVIGTIVRVRYARISPLACDDLLLCNS